jgi:hypothetical protein
VTGRSLTGATILALSVLGMREIGAQVCLGGNATSSLALAVAYGRAFGAASLVGADLAWQLSPSFTLTGDVDVTAYPTPTPARKRVALGVATPIYQSGNIAACLTPGVELERIGELHTVRVPLGISLGWGTTFSDGHGRLGLRVEPFVVYGRERVEMFTRSRGYATGRAGLVFGYDRLMLGLEHERAFDNDARWHTRLRFGFELKRGAGHTEGPRQRNP